MTHQPKQHTITVNDEDMQVIMRALASWSGAQADAGGDDTDTINLYNRLSDQTRGTGFGLRPRAVAANI